MDRPSVQQKRRERARGTGMRFLPATLVALIVSLIGGLADAGTTEAWTATPEAPGLEHSLPGTPAQAPALPGLTVWFEADGGVELESQTRSATDAALAAAAVATRADLGLVCAAASKDRTPADAPSRSNRSRAPPHA